MSQQTATASSHTALAENKPETPVEKLSLRELLEMVIRSSFNGEEFTSSGLYQLIKDDPRLISKDKGTPKKLRARIAATLWPLKRLGLIEEAGTEGVSLLWRRVKSSDHEFAAVPGVHLSDLSLPPVRGTSSVRSEAGNKITNYPGVTDVIREAEAELVENEHQQAALAERADKLRRAIESLRGLEL